MPRAPSLRTCGSGLADCDRPLEVQPLQHVRDKRRHRGTLGAFKRHVRKQVMTLERLDDRSDAVVPAHAQVVALGHVVGQHHALVLTDAAEHGEQHVALEALGLVHDHKGIV